MRTFYPKILLNNIKKTQKKFPSNLIKYNSLKESNTQVCLIGFQGSKLKNLNKYINIYKKKDYDIIVHTPGYFTNYNPKNITPLSQELSETLIDNNKKIIFHTISGGCFPLSATLQKIILNDKVNLIDKFIYDSSPVECSYCSAIRALYLANNKKIPNFILEPTMKLYYHYVQLSVNEWCYEHYNILGSRLLDSKKKLFIASGKDEITPLNNIEEFITGQKNINLKVFDNALHAKSILSNPDEYKQLINNFLDDKN